MTRYAAVLVCGASAVMLAGQTPAPKTHRLEATPATVAVGYYWAEAKPALRIASGDIIDVDTLLTNNPDRSGPRRRARRQDPGLAEGDRRPRSPAIAADRAVTSSPVRCSSRAPSRATRSR